MNATKGLHFDWIKLEKGSKVSNNMSQISSVQTKATVLTGLSIPITRFYSQKRRGLICKIKIPVQKLLLKIGGGEGRQSITGHYSNRIHVHLVL